MLFEFLRQQGVDISRYLPQFLFRDKEKNLQDLLAVCSWEHEQQRILLQEIAKQFFVETATWGLSDWERIVEVRPNPGDTYTQRRNRILLKLNGTQTSTLGFMERLIRRYVSDDSIIRLKESPEEYVFNIHFDGGQIIYPNDMMEAIRIYIPAHLGLNFWIEREIDFAGEGGLKYGFANLVDGLASVSVAKPEDFILRYSMDIMSGHSYHKTVRAGPVELSAKTPVLSAFAYIRSGFGDIPANLEDMPEWFRSITLPSRIWDVLGIAYDIKGRQRIPLAIPAAAEVHPSPIIATGKSGRRLYGIALPEDGFHCVRLGHAGAITGRGNVMADMGDLAEWIASIREPSRAAVRIAVESAARGRKILHTEMPQEAAAGIMLTASVRPSGRKSVGTATEDIPDFMRGFLESSTLAPRYAVKIIGTERRRFFPAMPPDADASMLAGFALGAGGRKSIPLAPPWNASIGCIIGNAHARTGRIIVGADRCDLPPGRRTRAHVGIMQAGLSAVG